MRQEQSALLPVRYSFSFSASCSLRIHLQSPSAEALLSAFNFVSISLTLVDASANLRVDSCVQACQLAGARTTHSSGREETLQMTS